MTGLPEQDHEITPRRVKFDWQNTPIQWIPGDPFSAHFYNALHLIFPPIEAWFCVVFKEALPLVPEGRLRRDVIGFMRQEAIHGGAHALVLDHFKAHGIDSEQYQAGLRRMIDRFLGERILGFIPAKKIGLGRWWLNTRIGLIAAGEHFTCMWGRFALENKGFDTWNADPTMLDLFRWHAAEEVEHRTVAFDLYRHIAPAGFLHRLMLMVFMVPMLTAHWLHALRFMMRHDPALPRRLSIWREWPRAVRAGRLLSLRAIARSSWHFLRRSYDPATEADTALALDYIARSPAAGRLSR